MWQFLYGEKSVLDALDKVCEQVRPLKIARTEIQATVIFQLRIFTNLYGSRIESVFFVAWLLSAGTMTVNELLFVCLRIGLDSFRVTSWIKTITTTSFANQDWPKFVKSPIDIGILAHQTLGKNWRKKFRGILQDHQIKRANSTDCLVRVTRIFVVLQNSNKNRPYWSALWRKGYCACVD